MKKICVIWASSGIGLESVKQYSEQWYSVDFTLRNTSQKAEFQKQFPESGIFIVDLSDWTQVKTFAEDLTKTHYDIIIFAAGTGLYKKFEDAEAWEITEQLQVNTLAPIHIIKEYFKKHDYSKTKFVYLSSVLERIPAKNLSVYSASKRATTQILYAFKTETPKLRILVVMLWAVKTPMHKKSGFWEAVWKDLHKTVKKLIKVIEHRQWTRTLYIDWLLMLWIVFPVYNFYLFLKNIWNKYL